MNSIFQIYYKLLKKSFKLVENIHSKKQTKTVKNNPPLGHEPTKLNASEQGKYYL